MWLGFISQYGLDKSCICQTGVGRLRQPKEVFAELLGKKDGAARGLGGSMHLYKRKNNFFGGIGIVGEQARLLFSCHVQ